MNETDPTPRPEPAPETIPKIVLLPKQDSSANGGVPPKKEQQDVGQAVQSSALQTTPLAGDLPPRRFLSLTGAMAAVLAFTFLVVVVYAFTRPSPLHVNADCDTDDCMQHAFLLSAALNRSLDPCDDFGTFVCSAWLASSAQSRSLQEDLWYRWTKQTALELERLRLYPDSRPIVKAAGLLQRCLDMDADASHENMLFLRHFFSQRNLTAVPGEAPAEGVHALDVLLDLAINWRMPLWFSVAVLKAGGNGPLGVLLDYGRYDAYWVNRDPPLVDEDSEDATMDNFILKNVIQTTTDMLAESKWIEEETKKSMLQQMKRLTINVFPDQQLMVDKTLSDLYRNFPGSRDIYARDMIESLTEIRRYLGTDLYTTLTSTPHGGRDPYLLYNVFNNSLTVAVGALSAPLFYPKGTTTMNYAGLGAAFASVLLRAIDGGYTVVGPNGWTLNKMESMYVKAPCVDMSFEGFYPSLPSLEVTHRSYLDALKKTGRSADEKLASLGEFTAEQVFFLTFCQRTCRQFDGEKTSGECNVAVRNFAPFTRAFSCRRNSNMNPNTKCAFFT
ncbi:hypothetical protein HPB49_008477 [Dermacentor silvarum]|uniref:Uncharacterized protein n=1 Tax=Dermacentor silvarum TaxID=543639 RepID=A0ACB8CJU8_DERSI|nr:hypothetical protein HPB49_008477 [Dermacentor silvarum]